MYVCCLLLLLVDVISAITELRFTALSFTSALIEWAVPTHCGRFQIQILFYNSIVYNTTSLITSVNVTGLSRGIEYNVFVFGISDSNELTRDKANILMTLDGEYVIVCHIVLKSTIPVPEQVTDLMASLMNNETVAIHVSFKVVYALHSLCSSLLFFPQQPSSSSRPPVMYYTVRHNVTTDGSFVEVTTILTNIRIDGAQPGHMYYIEVTAVNILGPGPTRSTCKSVQLYKTVLLI